MGILFFALTDAPKSRRIVHGLALLAVMGLSLLFNALPASAGAVQRLLWVAGFAWLIYLGSSAIHLQDNDQHAQ
jgi:threonine/homoserine/homoserine lactone efflux protein